MKRCPTCDREYPDEESFCSRDGSALRLHHPDPLVGRVIDERYRIDGFLGAGGMGVVYAGTQIALDRRIAIKLMPRARLRDERALKRFEREAHAISRLTSSHTVKLFDYGELADGERYMVMERLEGETLAETRWPLPARLVMNVAIALAESLAEAHALGIVHRDLKPANVFCCHGRKPFGAEGLPHVVVLDFGIAALRSEESLTAEGHTPGTPGFMAPEVIEGADADARADVYAVGAILYALIAGRPPFDGRSSAEAIRAQLESDPSPLDEVEGSDAPPALRRLVHQCLARDPRLRPADASALAKELARVSREGRSSAPPKTRDASSATATEPHHEEELPRPAAPSERPPPPMPRWFWIGLALTTLICLGVAALPFARRPAEPSSRPDPVMPSPLAISEGRALVGALAAHRFAEIDGFLSTTTAVAWTEEQRARVWTKLESDLGPFQDIIGERTVVEDAMRIVFLELRFRDATLDLRLTFDRRREIVGVWFGSPLPLPASSR